MIRSSDRASTLCYLKVSLADGMKQRYIDPPSSLIRNTTLYIADLVSTEGTDATLTKLVHDGIELNRKHKIQLSFLFYVLVPLVYSVEIDQEKSLHPLSDVMLIPHFHYIYDFYANENDPEYTENLQSLSGIITTDAQLPGIEHKLYITECVEVMNQKESMYLFFLELFDKLVNTAPCLVYRAEDVKRKNKTYRVNHSISKDKRDKNKYLGLERVLFKLRCFPIGLLGQAAHKQEQMVRTIKAVQGKESKLPIIPTHVLQSLSAIKEEREMMLKEIKNNQREGVDMLETATDEITKYLIEKLKDFVYDSE